MNERIVVNGRLGCWLSMNPEAYRATYTRLARCLQQPIALCYGEASHFPVRRAAAILLVPGAVIKQHLTGHLPTMQSITGSRRAHLGHNGGLQANARLLLEQLTTPRWDDNGGGSGVARAREEDAARNRLAGLLIDPLSSLGAEKLAIGELDREAYAVYHLECYG